MDAGVTTDPSCPRDRNLLVTGTLTRSCHLDEDCPFGSHCDSGTGLCTYTCLGTDDPDLPCTGGDVCDCLGRCAPPTGLPVDVDADQPQLTVSTELIQVPGASWSPQSFEITLRSTTSPSVSPTVLVRAPTGVLVSGSQTLQLSSWSFAAEDGAYAAHATVTVSSNSPDIDAAPWPIQITSADVSGAPRSILINVSPPVTTPTSGIYAGKITARNSAGAGVTTIPVTAWATPQFVLLFDTYKILSPDGVLGFSLLGTQNTVKWVTGDSGSQLTASIVSTIAPTVASNGDLSGGRFAVALPFVTTQQLQFDYNLQWQGDFTAATCAADSDCATGTHCEEEIGRCAPGSEWRQSGSATNTLLDDRSAEWVSASSWFLTANTEIFGIPSVPDANDIGRSLMCLQPLYQSFAWMQYPGFVHGGKFAAGTTSGELFQYDKNQLTWGTSCMQPVPLGVARDRSLHGETYGAGPIPLAGNDLLAKCLEDTSLHPPSTAGTTVMTNFGNWFSNDLACVSPSRLYPLLQWLTGWNGPTTHRGGLEARILHEVVSRWASALSFMAHQSTEELANDEATILNSSLPSTTDLDRSLSVISSEMALILGPRVSNALLTLPRDILRNPDYRDTRPVSYYTFDTEDMNGTAVLDVAGEAHGSLVDTNYSRPTDYGFACYTGECPDGIYAWENMTIPRGPAELYGDFQVAFSADAGYVASGTKRLLLEYGDSTNLLYQVYLKGDANNNAALYVKHGSRAAADPTTPLYTFSWCFWCGTNVHHLIISRQAHHNVASDGTVTWSSTYRLYVDGSFVGSLPSSLPLVTSLDPATAKGTFFISGYVNDLAFWDEAFDVNIDNSVRVSRTHDNYQLDAVTPQLAITQDPNHEEAVGDAPIMLETATSYLTATTTATSSGAGDAYADCAAGVPDSERRLALISRAGQALRYSWAAEAMAARMFDRAGKVGCAGTAQACPTGSTCTLDQAGESVCSMSGTPVAVTVPWADRYQRALGEVDAARENLIRTLQPIATCSDPYAISSAAVPLFFGDPVGTNARFFAASDYLLNTWAVPAVTRAQASLDQARDAWVNKRNSEIQQFENEQQQQERIDQVKAQYAQPVIDLCGLTGVDPVQVADMLDAGLINPETCFQVSSQFCQTAAGRASADCYRGEMGKAVLTIVSAQRGVDVAIASAEAAEGRWENQNQFCSEMQVRNATDLMALQNHTAEMNSLRKKRAAASAIGGILGGLSSGNIFGALGGLSQAVADKYDLEIQNAEAEYQVYAQMRVYENQSISCYHDADQLKFSIDTEYAVIKQRLVDVQLATLELTNDKSRILELKSEVHAGVAREEARTRPSVAFHYWLDPRIDTYKRDFDWARRLTFLAARAAEYEFQQSIPATANVLRAGSVDDLERVIADLQQEEASRTINGRRPQESSIVVSLRDDVLKLSGRDQVSLPVGERNWSTDTRFGKRLQEKFFAVYDRDGKYLGQGVPFTLGETGALQYRCAERLWRVNATIQGDFPDMSAPTVPVMLLKRNTFSSNWCDGHGDGSDMQTASVFPSTNLFDLHGGSTSQGDEDAFTAALLMPWFNVIRSEFYKDAYVEGSSEEFAGRGLYGDYILVFPEQGLLNWTDSDPSNDFPLSRAEDVLVRFDLLSVDDLLF